MAGILKITISESTKDLEQLLHQQSSARLKERLQALYWLKSGKVKTRQDLARLLARGESTVYRWLNLYKRGGLPGLLEVKMASGRAPKIQGQALERLKQRLAQPEGFNSYGAVQQWLADECEVEAAYKTVHQTVRYKLNSKLKVPRPRSHKAEEQAQQSYKKKLSEMIEVMVTHFAQGRPLRYFCTDESRWGLKTLTGRVITLRGVKPVALLQWPREAFWLYGAVEPLTGAHFFYSFSHLDGLCFNHFVEQFAAAFPESLNLLQLDQASAHIALEVNWPDNVVPLLQPAHSPELNPIERLWQDLRKHFKGQILATLDQLQQGLFAQLNALTHQTITSLTGYSYILDSLPI